MSNATAIFTYSNIPGNFVHVCKFREFFASTQDSSYLASVTGQETNFWETRVKAGGFAPGFAALNAGYVWGKRVGVFAEEISVIASARKSGHGVICCVKASVARASVITQGSLSTVAWWVSASSSATNMNCASWPANCRYFLVGKPTHS
jgi:hypothetical protein